MILFFISIKKSFIYNVNLLKFFKFCSNNMENHVKQIFYHSKQIFSENIEMYDQQIILLMANLQLGEEFKYFATGMLSAFMHYKIFA